MDTASTGSLAMYPVGVVPGNNCGRRSSVEFHTSKCHELRSTLFHHGFTCVCSLPGVGVSA